MNSSETPLNVASSAVKTAADAMVEANVALRQIAETMKQLRGEPPSGLEAPAEDIVERTLRHMQEHAEHACPVFEDAILLLQEIAGLRETLFLTTVYPVSDYLPDSLHLVGYMSETDGTMVSPAMKEGAFNYTGHTIPVYRLAESVG